MKGAVEKNLIGDHLGDLAEIQDDSPVRDVPDDREVK
jgi:hypothetical protein